MGGFYFSLDVSFLLGYHYAPLSAKGQSQLSQRRQWGYCPGNYHIIAFPVLLEVGNLFSPALDDINIPQSQAAYDMNQEGCLFPYRLQKG